MNELTEIYRRYITEGLVLAVAGNPVNKAEGLPSKLRLKPVTIKGKVMFQATRTVGTKEIHENLDADGAAGLLACVTAGDDTSTVVEDSAADTPIKSSQNQHAQFFKQIEIKGDAGSLLVLVSKKGKRTVRETSDKKNTSVQHVSRPAEHNRTRNYVLPEGTPVPFLVELGVMSPDGHVVKARYDKFRQINRYLEFVEDVLPSFPKGREVSIVDFGCGKSYLTFALYYYLHELKGFDVRITGLDLKSDVIEHCNLLAKKFKYDKLNFLHGDIADYTGTDSVDMVVTLHACDTATDYALYKAILWNAKIIFCVPCCQHELNRQITDERQKSVFRYGLIKERMAALYTDAFRADMLEEQGYKTQILEFIDMEHTPKNILIRAVKQHRQMLPKGVCSHAPDNSYIQLMDELGVAPTLYRLLHPQE